MQVNDHTEHHRLADGQLVQDASGRLWRVSKHQFLRGQGPVETWLERWSDEYAVWLTDDRVACLSPSDEPLFPLTVVQVVPEPAGRVSDLDAWRRVCMEAYRNLPANTAVTMGQVDAVLLAGAHDAAALDTSTAEGPAGYERLLDRVSRTTGVDRRDVDAVLSWCATDAATVMTGEQPVKSIQGALRSGVAVAEVDGVRYPVRVTRAEGGRLFVEVWEPCSSWARYLVELTHAEQDGSVTVLPWDGKSAGPTGE